MQLRILKTLNTSLIHSYLSYGVEAWHGTYKNYTSKIFVLRKKTIRAINNIACNGEPTHTLNVVKSLNFLISRVSQVSNYIFQLLHFNIDEERAEFTC